MQSACRKSCKGIDWQLIAQQLKWLPREYCGSMGLAGWYWHNELGQLRSRDLHPKVKGVLPLTRYAAGRAKGRPATPRVLYTDTLMPVAPCRASITFACMLDVLKWVDAQFVLHLRMDTNLVLNLVKSHDSWSCTPYPYGKSSSPSSQLALQFPNHMAGPESISRGRSEFPCARGWSCSPSPLSESSTSHPHCGLLSYLPHQQSPTLWLVHQPSSPQRV